MSSNNEYVNWIEEAISKKRIALYNFGDFKNVTTVGEGSYRANLKNWKQFFGLKSLTSIEDVAPLKELVNELKLHYKVDFHDNIVNFFGFSETASCPGIKKYLLVFEYAEFSLREYLRENFNKLTWKKKVQLASQLVKVMLYLHSEGIVHRDLHSGNVLVHQDNIKLADFGLWRRVREVTSVNDPFDLVPYIEPKRLADRQYSLDEKSDVYSVGVLLWEISSGKPPLYDLYKQGDKINSTFLVLKIFQGQREDIVPGTPNSYASVYQGCWDGEPSKRPHMTEVMKGLGEIDYFFNLVSNTVEFIYKIINTEGEKKLDAYIINHFKNENVSLQVLYNWLLNNQSDSDFVFLLGYLYYSGIGVEPSCEKAFNIFSSVQDHILAIYYIGLCHQYGRGVEKNDEVALMCFRNIKNQAMGQAKIGYLFSHLKQHQNAIDWYKVAAENGSFMAMHKLGKIFLFRKDYMNAIVFFEKAANRGYLKAINALGRCHEDGLGTTPNLEKAVELYHKAAMLGYNKSKTRLGKIFLQHRDENEENLAQAILWYNEAMEYDRACTEAYEGLKTLSNDPNVRNYLQSSNESHNRKALMILNSIS